MKELDKITIIGDIHGRTIWKEIVEKESYSDLFVFLGDYFDSYERITPGAEINNFKEIIDFKLANQDKVVLLVGNHDLHYVIDEHWSRYSIKTQELLGGKITELINNNVLQVCKNIGNLWFVHAGITNTWLRNYRLMLKESEINELIKTNPKAFGFLGGYYSDPYGDDVFQSPMWIRPASLNEDAPINTIQFVGHTQTNNQEIKFVKNINLCDSLEWNKYYTYEVNPITLGLEFKMKTI